MSFNRHCYKPQPLRTLAEVSADILAIEKEAEGLLDGLLGGGDAAVTKPIDRPERGLAKSRARATVPESAAKMPSEIDEAALLGDLRTLIQSARQRIATAAYSTQTFLCWHMGRRLDSEHLQGGRAAMANGFS